MWHYQIRRKGIGNKRVYEIVEVYSRPFGYTDGPIHPVGDTRRSLIRDLEMMLHDAKRHKTLIVNEGP